MIAAARRLSLAVGTSRCFTRCCGGFVAAAGLAQVDEAAGRAARLPAGRLGVGREPDVIVSDALGRHPAGLPDLDESYADDPAAGTQVLKIPGHAQILADARRRGQQEPAPAAGNGRQPVGEAGVGCALGVGETVHEVGRELVAVRGQDLLIELGGEQRRQGLDQPGALGKGLRQRAEPSGHHRRQGDGRQPGGDDFGLRRARRDQEGSVALVVAAVAALPAQCCTQPSQATVAAPRQMVDEDRLLVGVDRLERHSVQAARSATKFLDQLAREPVMIEILRMLAEENEVGVIQRLDEGPPGPPPAGRQYPESYR